MVAILLVAVIAVGTSVSAGFCVVDETLPNPQDRMLFGKVPWSLVGIMGYALIAVTAGSPGVNNILIGIAGLVTIHLTFKAHKLKIVCPVCTISWMETALLVVLTFFR